MIKEIFISRFFTKIEVDNPSFAMEYTSIMIIGLPQRLEYLKNKYGHGT